MPRKRQTVLGKLQAFEKELNTAWLRCEVAWRDDPEGWYMTRYKIDHDLSGSYPDGNDPFFDIGYLVQSFDQAGAKLRRGLAELVRHEPELMVRIDQRMAAVRSGWGAMATAFEAGAPAVQDRLKV